jgi:lysyl-tRNA synthetase class I
MENIDSDGGQFLSALSSLLSECEWDDEDINRAIADACESSGIERKKGYSSIYWALIGRSHGPKASSLLFELDRDKVLSVFAQMPT